MNNENDAAQGKHLDSLAAATKRYILAQILDVTDAVVAELSSISGSGVLDTVCPSVNGGLWYELDSGKPVVKIYYGGQGYQLGGGALEPTLTVAPSSLNISVGESASATISCDSGGNYLVTSLTEGVTAELVDNVVTVAHVLGIEEASIKIRVMASSGFNAAEILLPVRMAKASPGLTVTPSANTVPCAGVVTAEVSYSGGGTISVSSDNANVTPTYDANTKTITVPYNGHETSATITVELAASTGYLAATQSFTVTMEEPRTILTITPSAGGTKGDPITATVSCNSGGALSVACNNSNIDWTFDGSTITLPFYLFSQDTFVTVTVSAAAYDIYPAAEKSFTFTYFGGTSTQLSQLTVCEPFNYTLGQDLCGHSWSVVTGSPQIENGVLHITGDSGVAIPLPYQDGMTISFWFYFKSMTPEDLLICIANPFAYDERYESIRSTAVPFYLFYRGSTERPDYFHTGSTSITIQGITTSGWCHVEINVQTDGHWRTFLNGVYKVFTARSAVNPYDTTYLHLGSCYSGRNQGSDFYVSHLKTYPYVLHTADFTCPPRPPLPSIT